MTRRCWCRCRGMIEIRIGRCDVRFSILFPALILFVTLLDTDGIAAHCLLASIIHELGHLTALAFCKPAPAAMVINLFGIRIEKRKDCTLTYRQDMLISLAGPAANLFSAALLYVLIGHSMSVLVHLVLGIFHLLPIEPLDGGQMCLSFFRSRMPEETADRVMLWTSIITLIPMTLVSCVLLLQSGYNFSFLAVTAYVAALVFLKRK